MLENMLDIVATQRPDAFLLCGDVYHVSQPSATAQTMLANFLVELHKINSMMPVIITAGNHDSESRHEIFSTPWRVMGIYTIGKLNKDAPDKHIIELPGKGFIIAIPYANPRNVPDGFVQQLLDIVKERNTSNLPVVMMAHTTVRGCDFSGHDLASECSVGGVDAIDVGQMGNGYDYLALGHIHHSQFVHTGRHNVRYSGTPIAVSFDENYDHSVSIVELGKHGDVPDVKEIQIKNPRPLVSLPTEGFATWKEAKTLLEKFPDDISAYIRLNVEVEDFIPSDSYAEANQLTQGKQCRFCYINSRRAGLSEPDAKGLSIEELQHEDPLDVASRYADDIGIAFDEEIFRQATDRVYEDLRLEE